MLLLFCYRSCLVFPGRLRDGAVIIIFSSYFAANMDKLQIFQTDQSLQNVKKTTAFFTFSHIVNVLMIPDYAHVVGDGFISAGIPVFSFICKIPKFISLCV